MKPPEKAIAFLRWFCREDCIDEIEGDLTERFAKACKMSARKARWQFVFAVMLYFRPEFIKSFGNSYQPNFFGMYKNHFTIAWRNLLRNKGYSLINIGGLTVGVIACLVITLYIANETSYDRHFKDADRIYRVNTEIMFNGSYYNLASTPPAAVHVFEDEFPEVEVAMHFSQWPWRWVKHNTERFKEPYMAYASNGIFKVFSLPLLEGNVANALIEPNTLIISKTKAEKYFPGRHGYGQTLIIDDVNYKVTGVFNDFPETTHFKLDFILSSEGHWNIRDDSWLSNNFNTYVLLRKGAHAKDLEAKLPALVDKYFGPQANAMFGKELKLNDPEGIGDRVAYSLTPLTDIHLHSHREMEMSANGDISYVYLFGTVALFILVIACINFMNLSTARSANRAKEIGVRKALGSIHAHLIGQFLTESVLLSMCSFALALGLAYLILPSFNTLAELSLKIPLTQPMFILLFVVSSIIVGIFAGLYPSFFLSAFKPLEVLKGKTLLGTRGKSIRSTLVVFQFTISIFLVTGTMVVQKQISFIQNKNLGYDREQVLIVHNTETLGTKQRAFRNELVKNTMVTNASVSGFIPISGWARSDRAFWTGGANPSAESHISMQSWSVDYDYLGTFGMEIKQGRNFSEDFPSDSSGVIINEAAVKHFGFKDPIGEKIETFSFNDPINENKFISLTVIGVVKDFHYESLKQRIAPLCLYLGESNWSIPVRFKAEKTDDFVAFVEKTWKTFNSGTPFEYTFLDQAFGKMYDSEKRTGKVFVVFATLAIVLASLGLFALTAFTAEQRTKEIGIRKVLGASVSGVVYLLSKDFAKLIAIAFALSAPLEWFAVDWWLKDYVYKVNVGIVLYLSAGLFAFLIAWLTMSWQSVKAAKANPVETLRSE